jgi:hypothetical protein
MRNIFIVIGIILLVVWGLGLVFKLAGTLIHFLLVLAIISFLIHLIRGNRSV